MQIPSDTLSRFLRDLDLLADLRDGDIDRLLPHLDLVRASAGQGIFAEGATGSALYILLDGTVSIQRDTPAGPPHELALLEAGECFGEMALLDGAPRMATAAVVGDTLLARLSREAFDALIDQQPDLGARLLRSMSRVLCERQRALTAALQDLVEFDTVPDSAASAALHQAVLRHVTWN